MIRLLRLSCETPIADLTRSGFLHFDNVNRNRQTLYKNNRKFSSAVVDDPIELELMNLRREANEDKN